MIENKIEYLTYQVLNMLVGRVAKPYNILVLCNKAYLINLIKEINDRVAKGGANYKWAGFEKSTITYSCNINGISFDFIIADVQSPIIYNKLLKLTEDTDNINKSSESG